MNTVLCYSVITVAVEMQDHTEKRKKPNVSKR